MLDHNESVQTINSWIVVERQVISSLTTFVYSCPEHVKNNSVCKQRSGSERKLEMPPEIEIKWIGMDYISTNDHSWQTIAY